VRIQSGCAAAVAIVLSGALAALPEQTCKPVTGRFEAVVVPPGQGHCPNTPGAFCTGGRVWGGLQGDYQFVMTGMQPSAPLGGTSTVQFFAGQSTIFLQGGGTVQGTDTGSLDLPPGEGGFASLITFTGGTGATPGGQIRLRGQFDPEAGTTSGDYAGRACF
jgi:hypothetical protein